MKPLPRLVGFAIAAALVACSRPATPSPPATPVPPATATARPPASVTPRPPATRTAAPPTATPLPPAHHLAVRVIDGVGQFYDQRTGAKFVPRGNNYIRLAQQTRDDGTTTFGHALFDPGKYDSGRVAADLSNMHAAGYNVIRVFLSPDTLDAPDGGLSAAYLDNVADLLRLAQINQMYVIFTLDWIPGGKYGELLSADCCETFALFNANLLPPAGLKANQVFYQDFIRGLLARGAHTEHVFSYQLRNELFYDGDQPPLSLNSGQVATANGQTYDLSSAAAKEQMVADNLVYWIDAMRASILAVDPTALVSVGFFQPQGPNPTRLGDPRLAVTAPAIWQSTADFIDLHAYAGGELTLPQYVENYGMAGMMVKPIIMGEFGGEVGRFVNITDAAITFMNWQVESCRLGFDGWLFWTWDTDEQPDFFNILMAQGAINGVLAPVARPDPCST
ncbi:MAG: cellulase family glycosylhydrolase [Anaerolineales bacterium]|nr:cellulase family glycosylhydrolase [Anaerolineales bacterium]